jgi:hypothetical protein
VKKQEYVTERAEQYRGSKNIMQLIETSELYWYAIHGIGSFIGAYSYFKFQ